MNKSFTIFVLFFLTCFQLVAQNKENRWVVGAGIGVAKFSSKDVVLVGDQFNFQVPRLNVSMYFFNGLTLDAGFSFNTINEIPGVLSNNIPYFSIDLTSKYDFGTENKNTVPYIAFGGSFINVNNNTSPSLNFGAGGTFWLNPRYGINTQLLYKYTLTTLQNIRPHYYFSVGVVYSLKPRTVIPRLWNNN